MLVCSVFFSCLLYRGFCFAPPNLAEVQASIRQSSIAPKPLLLQLKNLCFSACSALKLPIFQKTPLDLRALGV